MRPHWPDCRNVRDLGGLPAAGGSTGRERALVRADSLLVALLLRVAGVPDDVIAEDYAFSAVCRERPGEPDPGTILAALARVDELHGDVDAYLLAHGLTGRQLDALRARLVA
ncbi:tyrosine-protein phosphatase [Dactylosporangium sp. CA-052675]|uniref:tyrosine-protein phosphatase n=1 Tax=Dactylosporangium sp. CA-052675 TaxID=3239927 RepID=UPI003D8CA847